MNTIKSERTKWLIEILSILAADASAQVRYLEEGGWAEQMSVGVDDMAIEFDGIACAKNDMLIHGEITKKQRRAIEEIDEYLTRISGHQNRRLWSEDALRNAEEWQQVRNMARECLALLSGDDASDPPK